MRRRGGWRAGGRRGSRGGAEGCGGVGGLVRGTARVRRGLRLCRAVDGCGPAAGCGAPGGCGAEAGFWVTGGHGPALAGCLGDWRLWSGGGVSGDWRPWSGGGASGDWRLWCSAGLGWLVLWPRRGWGLAGGPAAGRWGLAPWSGGGTSGDWWPWSGVGGVLGDWRPWSGGGALGDWWLCCGSSGALGGLSLRPGGGMVSRVGLPESGGVDAAAELSWRPVVGALAADFGSCDGSVVAPAIPRPASVIRRNIAAKNPRRAIRSPTSSRPPGRPRIRPPSGPACR